jgi:Domain of unknown function (DUF4386)
MAAGYQAEDRMRLEIEHAEADKTRTYARLAVFLFLVEIILVLGSGFVRLHLYISAQKVGAGTVTAEALADLMRSIVGTTENIGGICFGIGSLLFFYLFFKSRYIPRALSALGLSASVI